MAFELEVFGSKGVINPDKRVLIIGLGGTGADALLAAKDMMQKRFRLDGGRLPGNIEFLAIDTDESILNKKRGTAKIRRSDFVLLNDPMITARLKDKSELPEYYRNWLNPVLSIPCDFCPPMRQIGRYLLVSNYGAVRDTINHKIQSILRAAPGGTLIDIIILSGISGATGGGTFIDMGYMVRKVCEDMVIGDEQKRITAHLFLPDVNEFNPDVPNQMKQFIKVNGYAAMKDLDYFMSIPEKKAAGGNKAETTYKFRQKYNYNEEVDSDKAPFDVVYLIAGQADVLHPMPNAYEYAVSMSADSLVNFIGGSTAVGHTAFPPIGVAGTDIHGAPMEVRKASFVRPDGKRQLGVYKYRIMGASVATLPMKDITEYVAGLLLQKVDVLKKQLPTTQDFNDFYSKIGLNAVEYNVVSKIGAPDTKFTGSDLAGNPAYDQMMMHDLNRYIAAATSNIPAFVDMEIARLENKIFVYLNNYFSDIHKGPFFADRIMADGKMGVIAKLKDMVTQLNRQASGCVLEEQKLRSAVLAKKVEAENAHFGRAARYQEYINLRVAQAEQRVRGEICKALAQRINDTQSLGRQKSLVDTVSDKNRGVYEAYSTILSSLAERFADGGKVTVNRMGKSFMWDMVSLKDIEPVIKDAINDNELDRKMNDMLVNMVKESEEWCNDKNTMHKFGEFISQAFQDVLSTSMDKYLATIPPQDLEQMVRKLNQSAEEHFPENIGVYKYAKNFNRVTVPANAPMMRDVVETYLANRGITAPPQTSLLGERISWTRVSIGVPMFLYAYLPKYEEAYKNAPARVKIGLHLYENEGVCGGDYPALLPGMFYNDNFTNDAEERRRARMAALFDKAEALGLVMYDAVMKVSHEDWCGREAEKIFKKYRIDRNDIYGSIEDPEDLRRCRDELSCIAGKMDDLADVSFIYLPDMEWPSKHEDMVWYARESFCRMPEAKKPVEEEIAKIERVNGIIAELDKLLEEFHKDMEYYMTFVYAFVFDVIKKRGFKYVYMDGENELEIVRMFKNPVWRWEAFQFFNENLREAESENIRAQFDEALNDSNEIVRVRAALEDILARVTGMERAEIKELKQDDPRYESVNEFYKKLTAFIRLSL